MSKYPHLTILVPVLNEEEAIPLFIDRVEEVMSKIPRYSYEYLFLDGGSTDQTAQVLKQARQENDRVKIITLSRSFGKEASLFCGLQYAVGDAIIPMDVDLQDPPEVIPAFLEKWKEGYDVVYGIPITVENPLMSGTMLLNLRHFCIFDSEFSPRSGILGSRAMMNRS